VGVAPIVEVIGATKEYHLSPVFGAGSKISAMSDVSFSLYAGKRWRWLGNRAQASPPVPARSPACSTLTSGRILFRGTDIASIRGRKAALAYSRAVQVVFQDPFSALNPTHTV
jgi:peptide/nickel transport system ATP-binding protein